MQAMARKPLAPETEETAKDQSLSSMREDRSRGGPTEDLKEDRQVQLHDCALQGKDSNAPWIRRQGSAW